MLIALAIFSANDWKISLLHIICDAILVHFYFSWNVKTLIWAYGSTALWNTVLIFFYQIELYVYKNRFMSGHVCWIFSWYRNTSQQAHSLVWWLIPSNIQYKTHYRKQLNWRLLRCSWSIDCWRCSTYMYIFILDLTPVFNISHKDNCRPRREPF